MTKIDAWLIERTQSAYLWFLDRTGVYLGTVTMTVVVLNVGWMCLVARPGFSWIDAVCLGIAGLVSSPMWHDQHRKRFEAINASSLAWRASRTRTLMLITALAFGGWFLISNWRFGVVCLFTLAWLYLNCTMLRDREPKEFKQLKLALRRVK